MFKSMIDLEIEYGKVKLGHENINQEVQKILEMQRQGQRQPNPLWMKLAEVIKYGPKKMENFKQLIDQAQIDIHQEYEKQRKKALENYIKMRKTKGKKLSTNLQQIISTTTGDAEKARIELNKILIQEEAETTNQKMTEIKEMLQQI